MSKRPPRQTKRERNDTTRGRSTAPNAIDSDIDKRALFSARFPNERAACESLVDRVTRACAAGCSPAQLAALVNSNYPGSVLVTLGTRSFWKRSADQVGGTDQFGWLDEFATDARIQEMPVMGVTAVDDYEVYELGALATKNGLRLASEDVQ